MPTTFPNDKKRESILIHVQAGSLVRRAITTREVL